MAKDQTVPVNADALKADAAALAALAKMADYTPANADFALTKLQAAAAAQKAAAAARGIEGKESTRPRNCAGHAHQ